MGLLGLAFSPDWKDTSYFYINYIDQERNTVISRFKHTADNMEATVASETIILSFWQPYEVSA